MLTFQNSSLIPYQKPVQTIYSEALVQFKLSFDEKNWISDQRIPLNRSFDGLKFKTFYQICKVFIADILQCAISRSPTPFIIVHISHLVSFQILA